MRHPFTYKLTALLFALLLLLPTADCMLGLSVSFENTENRQRLRRPVFEFPHVMRYKRDFEAYYKQTFGWRDALFQVYSRWKLFVLGQSPLPEKVVIGRQGWFFLGNSENRVMDQHRGLLPWPADSLTSLLTHLHHRQAELARYHSQLIVVVPPDAQSVYSEYLPEQLVNPHRPSRLDVLHRHISRLPGIHFIDLRDTLQAAKRRYQLYYQTDTHWNNVGSLVSCAALMKHLHRLNARLPVVDSSAYTITPSPGFGGDLVRMIGLQQRIKDPLYYNVQRTDGRSLPPPDTLSQRYGSPYPILRFTGTDCSQPRLLFVGDSFSLFVMQYLPHYFSESIFVRDCRLDARLLNTVKPDIVVFEVVERNINLLSQL